MVRIIKYSQYRGFLRIGGGDPVTKSKAQPILLGILLLFKFLFFSNFNESGLQHLGTVHNVLSMVLIVGVIALFVYLLGLFKTPSRESTLFCVFLVADPFLLTNASQVTSLISLALLGILFLALSREKFLPSALALFLLSALTLTADPYSFFSVYTFALYFCVMLGGSFSPKQRRSLLIIALGGGLVALTLGAFGTNARMVLQNVLNRSEEPVLFDVPMFNIHKAAYWALAILLGALILWETSLSVKKEKKQKKVRSFYLHAVFGLIQLVGLALHKTEFSYATSTVAFFTVLLNLGTFKRWFSDSKDSPALYVKAAVIILLLCVVTLLWFPDAAFPDTVKEFLPY